MKLTSSYVKFAYSYERLSHVKDSHDKDMDDKNYFTCSDIMKVDNYDDIQFMRISDCINPHFMCDKKFRYPKNLKQLVFCPYSFPDDHFEDFIIPFGFPHFPNGLEELIVYVHHYIITYLPNTLKYFSCEGSRYIKFECELPANLIEFNCSDCYIGLYVYGGQNPYIYWNMPNKLEVPKNHPYYSNLISIYQEKLPNLPPKLERLDCSNNYLVELPELPPTLKYINLKCNTITDVPPSLINCNMSGYDDSDDAFNYYFVENNIFGKNRRMKLKLELGKVLNPMFNFKYERQQHGCYLFRIPEKDNIFNNDAYYTYKKFGSGKPQKVKLNMIGAIMKRLKLYKAVPIIENWFLECKYNPKYGYCQRRLQSQYDEMFEDKIEQNTTN